MLGEGKSPGGGEALRCTAVRWAITTSFAPAARYEQFRERAPVAMFEKFGFGARLTVPTRCTERVSRFAVTQAVCRQFVILAVLVFESRREPFLLQLSHTSTMQKAERKQPVSLFRRHNHSTLKNVVNFVICVAVAVPALYAAEGTVPSAGCCMGLLC